VELQRPRQRREDDRRRHAQAAEHDLGDKLRLVVPVGGAQVFAACHYHGAVGNDTGRARFSLDWRVVHRADLESGEAPANLDSHGRGTSLRDFRRARDLAPMPEELAARYDVGYRDEASHSGKVLVYRPS
jgi:hypothetical protein